MNSTNTPRPMSMCMYMKTTAHNQTDTGEGPMAVRIFFSLLVFLLNSVLLVALIKSWSKLRQNVYVFVAGIVACDGLLGFVSVVNVAYHMVAEVRLRNTEGMYQYETAWFYIIKSSTFMAAEVYTAGNTALIALAFARYISAQSHQHTKQLYKRSNSGINSKTKKSLLLSRKKSCMLSMVVLAISLGILINGIGWNCMRSCACFYYNGRFSRTEAAAMCHHYYKCSYIYPSLNIYLVVVSVVLFLISLTIVIVMCIRTIHKTDGLASILPYSLHLRLVRRSQKRRQAENDEIGNIDIHRRHSIQLSYMRNMSHFILSVTVVYISCRLPANIILLLESCNVAISISSGGLIVVGAIAFIHSLLNPIVFYVTLQPMRKAVYHLLAPCCTRTIETKRGIPKTVNSQPSQRSDSCLKRETPNTDTRKPSEIFENRIQTRKRSDLSNRVSAISTISVNRETSF